MASDRSDDDEMTPTLLDKATEFNPVEMVAAEVIMSKLDKLRRIEEIIEDEAVCACESTCDYGDADKYSRIVGVVQS